MCQPGLGRVAATKVFVVWGSGNALEAQIVPDGYSWIRLLNMVMILVGLHPARTTHMNWRLTSISSYLQT